MIKLVLDYSSRKAIRIIFWSIVGLAIGYSTWDGTEAGVVTGITLGAVFALVIDEKFYKRYVSK